VACIVVLSYILCCTVCVIGFYKPLLKNWSRILIYRDPQRKTKKQLWLTHTISHFI